MTSTGSRRARSPHSLKASLQRSQPMIPRLVILTLALGSLESGCGRMLVGKLPGNDAGTGGDGRAETADTGKDLPGPADGGARPDGPADVTTDADADGSDTGRDANGSADGGRDAADTGTTPPDAGPPPNDAGDKPPIGIIAGRITMSSDTLGIRNAGVAGARVSLAGPSMRSAITDANGAYQFPNLAPGSYAVTATKEGATFTPPSAAAVVVGGDSAGVFAGFTCTAPCGTGPTIDPNRELFVQDVTVLSDSRAHNDVDGAWSFRYLMEQAATTAPNAYTNAWIDNLANSGRDVSALRMEWPTVPENSQLLPDLSRAPFQLLAIVNGIDAHAAGQGELRFVYGIYDVPGVPGFSAQGRTFTVMFSYALPVTTAFPNRQAWARGFHNLGAIPFGADYNAALEALTNIATRVGAQPTSADNPRGSALVAVSINEQFRTPPYQLRQFRPLPDSTRGFPLLVVSPLPQTPDSSLNAQLGDLPDFLNASAALIQAGLVVLPSRLLGTQSSAFATGVTWSFPGVTNEALRHAFAGQTCIGCHSSEAPSTVFTIFHVIPFGGPNAAGSKSGLVSGTEIPRRTSFLQNQLTCSGGTCALGAEPML